MANDYSFSGSTGGEQWRVKVRGYWISKIPALLPVLDWAEKQGEKEITDADLEYKRVEAVATGEWRHSIDEHVLERMNEVTWGFLNMALKAEAHPKNW